MKKIKEKQDRFFFLFFYHWLVKSQSVKELRYAWI